MKHKIYLSASTQEHNTSPYIDSEENVMFKLCDYIEPLLIENGNFEIIRNTKEMSIEEEVEQCNSEGCEIYISNHSNAGVTPDTATGYEIFTCVDPNKALELASFVQVRFHENGITLTDRGLKQRDLYVLRKTDCPAILIEHFFHDNMLDVNYFNDNVIKFIKSVYEGICDYYGLPYDVPSNKSNLDEAREKIIEGVNKLFDELKKVGI